MKLKDLLDELERGWKLRRRTWGKGFTIGPKDCAKATSEDLLADDWEVVEEPFELVSVEDLEQHPEDQPAWDRVVESYRRLKAACDLANGCFYREIPEGGPHAGTIRVDARDWNEALKAMRHAGYTRPD